MARQFLLGASLCGIAILTAAVFQSSGAGEPGSVRVYTKNLWYANREANLVVADLLKMKPDIVFLQEVSSNNTSIMQEMESELPFQALCPWQGWNGMAILSRWPLSDTEPLCSPKRSLMTVRIESPDGPFWAVGVHLQQPWPDVQWQHLEQALPILQNLDGSAIVAGDFNTVPWSAAARTIGSLTGTSPVRPQSATFRIWGIPLPLDQVWARDGRAQTRPKLGSDHLGVLADVWPSKYSRPNE